MHASRYTRRRARLEALGTCTPPTASILPTLIYPSTVDNLKASLKASLDATAANVLACTTLDPTTAKGWASFYAAAAAFAVSSTSYFGLGTQMDQAESYGYQLCQWQEQIAKTCTLSVPEYQGPQQPISPSGAATAASAASAVKWAAAAAIVLGVAYTASPAVRALAHSMGRGA